MVGLQDLSLRLEGFELNKINLTVRKGEIVAFLGPTGAGKTTLLELIAGYRIPDAGEINLAGKEMNRIPPEKRNIGFVYQDYALFPHMTAYQNIEFGLKLRKVPKSDRCREILELSHLLGIGHLMKRFPRTLSGGERQRVALARALVLHPDLLLMDEPFSSLDYNTKEKAYEVLKTIHDVFHCTILFVTHDISEAKKLADHIGIIINGTLCCYQESGKLPRTLDFEQFLN